MRLVHRRLLVSPFVSFHSSNGTGRGSIHVSLVYTQPSAPFSKMRLLSCKTLTVICLNGLYPHPLEVWSPFLRFHK